METTVTKNKQGYGYKYTDLAQIHDYLEENNMRYYQFIKRIEGEDYVFTRRFVEGKWEDEPIQGCRVVNAVLSGKSNPAQEQGSALTYARRYSVLMAFGLATEDDDGEALTRNTINTTQENALRELITIQSIPVDKVKSILSKYKYVKLSEIETSNYTKILKELEEK